MVTIGIILFLLLGIYTGARRGLVLQVVHVIGYGLSAIIASMQYQSLARILEMYVPYPSFVPGNSLSLFSDSQAMGMDQAFYRLISWIVVMAIVGIIMRFVISIVREITKIPIIREVNTLGGAILGFVLNYIGLFLLLYVLAMIPVDSIQRIFTGNSVANLIVTHTPVLTRMITNWLL